jgi:hypothetical protein
MKNNYSGVFIMLRNLKYVLILFVLIFCTVPVIADEQGFPKLSYGDNRWITLHLLLQAQLYSQNNYEKGESEDDAVWSKGAQMRRSRIILNGQVNKKVEFFYQTDDIFVGRQGSGSQYSTTETSSTGSSDNHTHSTKDSKGIYTQDAFINYKLSNEFEAAIGLICLPFMHHNRESAASLLGVDYNSRIIPINGITNEWRDTGVEFRGIVNRVLDYRLGVFRGYPKYASSATESNEDRKTDSYPRFCGRFQLNFMDPETGFFYSGNYLGKKSILSIGGGIDFQKDAAIIQDKVSTYIAYTGDLTIDYKINDDLVFALHGAIIKVVNQPGQPNAIARMNQSGYFGQMGVLLAGQVQPVIGYQYWNGLTLLANDKYARELSYMTFGLNYFIDGNNASIKAEYQNPMGRDNKAASGEKKATIQCQIFI